MTVVIVRDDLIADGPAFAQTPQYMNLKTQAAKGSMLNTPNTFGIYVCGKVFRWVEQTGGLAAMAERNWAKANLLYDLLEHSELFHGTAQANSRSIANVTFRTGDANSTRPLLRARQSTRSKTSRAIASSAECAPACTTPSPWRTCRRWPRT